MVKITREQTTYIIDQIEGRFRHVVLALCAYECVAIVSGKCPTLSHLSWRYKWIGPVLVGGLSAHLFRYSKKLEAELKEIVLS